ncbi:sugar ABC transporter permease [Paenibacillus doosanensis]|uniref:Lactose transport system permease protein LacF n=1 Tax=Paenibacillus konkukensis TaxID=2020716 RepID=A0ABY4RKP7_9BACL|nr:MULTISPECIES: sugar ABC transporter permease [Paenibacillus]MCS7460048.1 sugar ABC transporter permease [Paenibacillus doosanensis]UQZ82703.1 Lactose transport system permease protein LacF [Paenibacillus konkukensis]
MLLKKKWREYSGPYLMVLPCVILLALFTIYPMGWAFKYMFYDYDGFSDARFIGMDNFVRLFTRDAEFWQSVRNTGVFTFGKLIVTLPLALILAFILNQSRLFGKNTIRAILFMPTIISAAVISLVFYLMFNSYNGIINNVLIQFGIIQSPIEWLGIKYSMATAIIVAIWGALGNYMVLFLAGLQGIPNDLYEAASLDGANKTQQFIHVTIPMLGPVMQIIIMLAIVNTLKSYEGIMVLTAGGPVGKTEVMYLYIYKLFFPVSEGEAVVQQYGYGAAAGFVSALIVGIITGLYLFISRKSSESH